jgi:ABC-type branched-subunit amino acid transport system permease subunit
MIYYNHIIIIFAFYAIVGFSLNLIVGQLGIMLLCQSAFFALGAYTIGILCGVYNVPFFVAILLAPLISLLFAMPLIRVSSRLKHDALVLVSLAILMITLELIENLRTLTGGLDGLVTVSGIQISTFSIKSDIQWIGLLFILLLIVGSFVRLFMSSLLSKRVRAFRDSPKVSVTLGIQPYYHIGLLFAISVSIASVAGGLYSCYTGYLNPAMFSFDHSVLFLTIVVVGGAETFWGPVLGAAILVILPELFRFTGINTSSVGAIQQLLYGIALLVFVLCRPRGILKGYKFK